MMNAIAVHLGLGVADLTAVLTGQVTSGFAEAVDIQSAMLQSFVDGRVYPYWVDLFNAPLDQIEELRSKLDREGAAALLLGILIARNADVD